MSGFRQVTRLFNRRALNAFSARGYAERSLDEMSFTFAAANQVMQLKIYYLTDY